MPAEFPDTAYALLSYTMILRVPLLVGLFLIAFPIVAFRTSARSLLAGLFDVGPLGMLGVALAACAAGEAVAANARVIWLHSHDRLAGLPPLHFSVPEKWLWVTLLVALPLLATAYRYSSHQIDRSHRTLQLYLLLGIFIALSFGFSVHHYGSSWLMPLSNPLHNLLIRARTFIVVAGYLGLDRALKPGETDPVLNDHLDATLAMLLTVILYIVLGVYGKHRLGQTHTVPALCSALMIVMLLCWTLSAISFFTELYRVPILLIILIAGIITAQSSRADHFYSPIAPIPGAQAPDCAHVVATAGERLIVAAANGGGIQASAWTAQVLQGLQEKCGTPFHRSLRFISSVSGGSVGTAHFVNWLANNHVRRPAEVAAESSLDEVAWGLAWPDLLRALFPWFSFTMGRGRALEAAWIMNSNPEHKQDTPLKQPLSSWIKKVSDGDLPAVTFNATLTETGERLLFSTTRFVSKKDGRARVDGSDLHPGRDLSIVTAARLSASFPYIMPAARSDLVGPRPHVVDGGYYDNYGMATLVEWLDDALSSPIHSVKDVLVLQIHGARLPSQQELVARRGTGGRGWFYQAFAPFSTLLNVRSTGQVAHNDVEFALLQEKWAKRGITIQTTTFEFPNENAPLSWHLTASQQAAISHTWITDPKTQRSRNEVEHFLAKSAENGDGSSFD
jgi:hypothetical protein